MTGSTGSLSFILSLWMSLVTAVICATLPSGLPATRSIGSAFDPSTTIVALRSRPPVAKPALLLTGDDDLGAGLRGQPDPSVPLLVAPAALVTFAARAPAALAALPPASPRPRALDSALYARPPPTA